jgi:hypothetical protein
MEMVMRRIFLAVLWSTVLYATPIDIGIGAKSQGMGKAFVAVADDVTACYWNPAGLCYLSKAEIGFMHTAPFGIKEVCIDWIGVAQPLGKRSGIGLSYLRKSASLEEKREKEESRMAESEYALSLSAQIANSVSLGLNIKRNALSSKIGKSSGMGFDVGILYKAKYFPMPGFSFGAMYRNLSSEIKGESFFSEIRVGMAERLWKNRLLLSADLNMKREVNKKKRDWQWHIGAELEAIRGISLRAGLDDRDIACGVGLFYKRWRFNWSFLAEKGYELGNSHRFEIGMVF